MEDFGFKLIENFKGYNSASDKTILDAGFLIRGSKNVYKKITGTIASRPGLKRRGSADATSAGVKSSFEWTTNVGTERPLRVCNNKLQVESDIVTSGTYVWYDLLETSTLVSPAVTYTRFIFDTWWDNDEKTDRLLMVRGDDKILHWSGGMALVSSATADTITKQGTDTWAESGFKSTDTVTGEKKIIIDGREFTYTGGEGTTTLTGVTASSGLVSTLTSGMVAIQSVMVADNKPIDTFKADFIKVIGNQAWIGSYSSRVIYVSADVTVGGTLGFLNYTNTGDLVAGDPDTIVLDSLAKGIGVKDGKITIFGGDSELYFVIPNDDLTWEQTIGGSDVRIVVQRIEKKQLAGLTSALGHEFIGNFGDYLVWLDQKNRLRALGVFTNETSVKPVTLSLAVQDELSSDDFTGGHLKVIDDTIYITAPNNARDWMYTTREKINDDGSVSSEGFWQPPQIREIQRFAVISGVVYGHSNTYPQLYQIWDTNQWFDDNPNNEEMPYSCVARFSYLQHGLRQGKIIFSKVYVEGYMYQGTELNLKVYYDYQGASATRDQLVSNDTDLAKFFVGTDPSSFGESSLGDNPLGDGILEETNNQELVPKFRAIVNISQAKNCFEYSLEFNSTDIDARWELLCFGPDVKQASEIATFLRK